MFKWEIIMISINYKIFDCFLEWKMSYQDLRLKFIIKKTLLCFVNKKKQTIFSSFGQKYIMNRITQ